MSKAFSPISLHPTRDLSAFAARPSTAWRLDWRSVESEMVRALDAIRDCARIAWWDGSSIGLRLHGFLGFFEGPDGLDESAAPRRGDCL